jgi:hypothetical protein
MSKTLSWIFGIGFLALAALRAFQGDDMVLGLFHVDTTHNMIHLGSGVLGIVAALAGMYYARLYLWTIGLAYLATAVAGFITGNVMDMPLNTADNFLHLGIAAVSLYAVFAEDPYLGKERVPIVGRRGVTDFREPLHRW